MGVMEEPSLKPEEKPSKKTKRSKSGAAGSKAGDGIGESGYESDTSSAGSLSLSDGAPNTKAAVKKEKKKKKKTKKKHDGDDGGTREAEGKAEEVADMQGQETSGESRGGKKATKRPSEENKAGKKAKTEGTVKADFSLLDNLVCEQEELPESWGGLQTLQNLFYEPLAIRARVKREKMQQNVVGIVVDGTYWTRRYAYLPFEHLKHAWKETLTAILLKTGKPRGLHITFLDTHYGEGVDRFLGEGASNVDEIDLKLSSAKQQEEFYDFLRVVHQDTVDIKLFGMKTQDVTKMVPPLHVGASSEWYSMAGQTQRGVDVAFCMRAIEYAMGYLRGYPKMTDVVLVTADSDMVPCVETVQRCSPETTLWLAGKNSGSGTSKYPHINMHLQAFIPCSRCIMLPMLRQITRPPREIKQQKEDDENDSADLVMDDEKPVKSKKGKGKAAEATLTGTRRKAQTRMQFLDS